MELNIVFYARARTAMSTYSCTHSFRVSAPTRRRRRGRRRATSSPHTTGRLCCFSRRPRAGGDYFENSIRSRQSTGRVPNTPTARSAAATYSIRLLSGHTARAEAYALRLLQPRRAAQQHLDRRQPQAKLTASRSVARALLEVPPGGSPHGPLSATSKLHSGATRQSA